MPEYELLDVTELIDREIRSKRSLLSLLSHNSNSHICFQNHANIVSAVSDTGYSLASVLDHAFGDISFLGGRASAYADDGGFACDFEEEGF